MAAPAECPTTISGRQSSAVRRPATARAIVGRESSGAVLELVKACPGKSGAVTWKRLASKGASAYSAKVMEFVKANTTANLDFAQELLSLKSPTDAMELWTAHTRKAFETLSAQAKELAELTQKVAAETVEPIKANAAKFYKPAA